MVYALCIININFLNIFFNASKIILGIFLQCMKPCWEIGYVIGGKALVDNVAIGDIVDVPCENGNIEQF